MIMIANSDKNIEVGKYLTEIYHTDRRSSKIIRVDGDEFETEDGGIYIFKDGVIKYRTEQVVFINVKNDCSNLLEEQRKYLDNGGVFNPFAITVVEGITRLKKSTKTFKNAMITSTDNSYFDPHF